MLNLTSNKRNKNSTSTKIYVSKQKKLSTSLITILTVTVLRKMTAYESKTSYSYKSFHYKIANIFKC